ncbi:MAG: hypothetical protein WC657_04660 [Candidatus Paceibacterota bacterium]|jgi:hypothetical protein
MIFRSGSDLEDAVFGRHSSGEKLVEKFRDQRPDFDEDVRALIRDSYARYPEVLVGKLFWLEVKRELERLGVDPYGLVFLSAIDTKVDLRHFADGVFFLPSVPRYPVTIDTFNLDPGVQKALKDSWVDSFEGHVYTSSDFQSDLFRYKIGLTKWKKDCQKLSETGLTIAQPKDFRQYTTYGRPENHFILPPYHVVTYRRRREFAKMIAGYLLKVSCQNTAQLSH